MRLVWMNGSGLDRDCRCVIPQRSGQQRLPYRPVRQPAAVGNIAYNELEGDSGRPSKRRGVCGVGHLIQHSNSVISVIDEVVNKVRTDKTGTAGNKNVSHTVDFTRLNSDFMPQQRDKHDTIRSYEGNYSCRRYRKPFAPYHSGY